MDKDTIKALKIPFIVGIIGLTVTFWLLSTIEDEVPLGGAERESVESVEADIIKQVEDTQALRAKEAKYLRISEKEDRGVKHETHEYLTPKGEKGYQIILRKTVDGKEYVKSVGYGVEADSRTSDWALVTNEEELYD